MENTTTHKTSVHDEEAMMKEKTNRRITFRMKKYYKPSKYVLCCDSWFQMQSMNCLLYAISTLPFSPITSGTFVIGSVLIASTVIKWPKISEQTNKSMWNLNTSKKLWIFNTSAYLWIFPCRISYCLEKLWIDEFRYNVLIVRNWGGEGNIQRGNVFSLTIQLEQCNLDPFDWERRMCVLLAKISWK